MVSSLVPLLGHEAVTLETPSRGGVDLGRADPGEILDRLDPDAVVNAAAMSSVTVCRTMPAEAFRVNSAWPGALARACRVRGIGLVHVSTDLVYSGGNTPYSEGSPAVPLSVYGWTKLLGDLAVMSGNRSALVLRTSVLFGPAGASRPTFSEELLSGNVRELHVDAFRNHTPMHWFARILLDLLSAGVSGLLVVSAAYSQSRSAFAEALLAHAGARDLPPLSRRPPGTPGDLSLDPGLARARFGIPLPDLPTSIGMEYGTEHPGGARS